MRSGTWARPNPSCPQLSSGHPGGGEEMDSLKDCGNDAVGAGYRLQITGYWNPLS
jgi:hypothetical protein